MDVGSPFAADSQASFATAVNSSGLSYWTHRQAKPSRAISMLMKRPSLEKQSGRQDTVRTFSRRRPELERRDAANSLWAFGWRGSIITTCNNRSFRTVIGPSTDEPTRPLAMCHAGTLPGEPAFIYLATYMLCGVY